MITLRGPHKSSTLGSSCSRSPANATPLNLGLLVGENSIAKLVTKLPEKTPGQSFRNGSSETSSARQRFERHFGELRTGNGTGAINEEIDADLAREYSDMHEDR